MRHSLVVLALVLVAPAARAAEPPWVSLFDGKTLKGWTQKGGTAKYEAKDGTILGSSVPNTKNSFLSTEKSYGDFILEIEFKVDPELNSGIQIRGQSSADYQDFRVHGYQIEIDPDVKRDRMWTGGLYDEGRRGWLQDLKDNELARRAFIPGEWNKLRIEAFGESIKSWLNGVPATNYVDSMDLDGFIGLQVHQVGKREEPFHVAWRNIRIQDWGRHAWRPLWNGKDLHGFHPAGGATWNVTDGVLTGVMQKSSTAHGLLWSDLPAGDFTARLEYRTSGYGALRVRSDAQAGHKPLYVPINPRRGLGAIQEIGGRTWISGHALGKQPKPDDWQELTVSARGGRIIVTANGFRGAVASDDKVPRTGALGLELVAGQDAKLEVRRFELLSDAAIPPPVPGFPIGWCIRANGSAPDDAKVAGFEYVELAMQDVLSLSDEDFDKAVARFTGLGVPARLGYNIIPNELMVVGPDADKAKQDAHLAKVFARAKRLGLQMVVLNNGPSRKVPDGFSEEKAWKQLVDFGRRAADIGKKNGLMVLVEPLRKEETNLVTNVPDALKLVQAVGRPNFQLLVDYSFMAMQKEDPAVLAKAKGHLKHVWISNPNGRVYPLNASEADYGAFFTALKKIRYSGGLSVHARTDNFFADAPPAISFLRQQAAALK